MIAAPVTHLRIGETHRLVPSRYPSVGILDEVASPEDLDEIIDLEGWTNDRLTMELGVIRTIPPAEWVVGRPFASVIMAAFCHPRIGGSRFTGEDRGAWYAAFTLETALAETIYHRTQELREVGAFDTYVQMRQYLAAFDAPFHDVRGNDPAFAPLHDPVSYAVSQDFGRRLFEAGSNGVLYRSVRHPGGECLACFRPPLVLDVRQGAHFEYRWEGRPEPTVRRLDDPHDRPATISPVLPVRSGS